MKCCDGYHTFVAGVDHLNCTPPSTVQHLPVFFEEGDCPVCVVNIKLEGYKKDAATPTEMQAMALIDSVLAKLPYGIARRIAVYLFAKFVESGLDGVHDRHLTVLNEIRILVDRGEKIQAIKRLREVTVTGLKEAKDAVDALQSGDRRPALRLIESCDTGACTTRAWS